MSASQDGIAARRRCGLTDEQWTDAVVQAVTVSTREQELPTTLEDEAVSWAADWSRSIADWARSGSAINASHSIGSRLETMVDRRAISRHIAVTARRWLSDENDQCDDSAHDEHDGKCDQTPPQFARSVRTAISPLILIFLEPLRGRALHLRHRVRLVHHRGTPLP